MHIHVQHASWHRTDGFHERVWRDGDAGRGTVVRDEGVYKVEDEAGIEEDGGEEVGC